MFEHVHHDFPKLLQENVDGSRHYVTPTGEKYPSVTTILSNYNKKAIDAWKARVGEKEAARVSKRATDRGTSVHAAIEKLLNNEDMSNVSMMPNVKTLFVRMKEELRKVNRIHALETKLFSHELKLAGTVDCIAEYNGVLSVIDFKTSARLKRKEWTKHYFMQGAAYATMFTEMTGVPVEDIVILIGVDTANFCQTFRVKVADHVAPLMEQITKYNENQAGEKEDERTNNLFDICDTIVHAHKRLA